MAKDCSPLDDINIGGSSGGARGARPALPPLFWVNKEEMTEGRKASWASILKPGPLLLDQSLDSPLINTVLSHVMFSSRDAVDDQV